MDDTEEKPARRRRHQMNGLANLTADPIDKVMRSDIQQTADDLQTALNALGGVAESGVQVIVYKCPERGSWQLVKELQPPFSVTGLAQELETHYGPGKYAIRLLANDKIKTTKFLEIAAPKSAHGSILGLVGGAAGGGFGQGDLLKLLLERKPDEGNKEMFMLMMNMQQQSSQNMMTMQMENTKLVVSLMTSLMTGRSDPAEQFAKIGTLLKDMQAPPQTLKETLEILSIAKDFATGGGDGDGLMNMAQKFLPAIASMAQASGQAGGGQVAPGQPWAAPGGQPPALPAPMGRAPPPPIPGAGVAANDTPAGTAPDHPILGLIRADIEYFMHRGHDPELAADALADILHAHQVTREQLLAFGMEIQGTDGDYVGRLRALGLDVSAHTDWFVATLTALADYDGGGDEPGDEGPQGDQPPASDARAARRGTDPVPDASARPPRGPANPRQKQGGSAN